MTGVAAWLLLGRLARWLPRVSVARPASAPPALALGLMVRLGRVCVLVQVGAGRLR